MECEITLWPIYFAIRKVQMIKENKHKTNEQFENRFKKAIDIGRCTESKTNNVLFKSKSDSAAVNLKQIDKTAVNKT